MNCACRSQDFLHWNQKTTTYKYSDVHSLTNTIYPNTLEARYSFDDATRLTGIKHLAAAAPFVNRAYILDRVGNIAQERIAAGLLPPAPVQPSVRLLAQNSADMLTTVGTKVAPADQAWSNRSYFHDKNGNLLADDAGLAISYDYDDRMTNLVNAGVNRIYKYDGLGDRTERMIAGVTYVDVLDRAASLHNVLMVVDEATGQPVCYYIWGRGLIARIDADGTTTTITPMARAVPWP